MSDNRQPVLLGNNLEEGTVSMIFSQPIDNLIMTADECETLAVQLFQRARYIKAYQRGQGNGD